MIQLHFCLLLTFSIRIVAYGVHYCQVTRELKQTTTLEFTAISVIIFIPWLFIVNQF